MKTKKLFPLLLLAAFGLLLLWQQGMFSVLQERAIETVIVGSVPAYATGNIPAWTCPATASDGRIVDRCQISNGVSLAPNQVWQGVCYAEQSSQIYQLCCRGEIVYGQSGSAIDCKGTMATSSGIRNLETSYSASLYESLIQCPNSEVYAFRSSCPQANDTSSVNPPTNPPILPTDMTIYLIIFGLVSVMGISAYYIFKKK